MKRLEQLKSKKRSVSHSKGNNAMRRNVFLVIKTVLLLMLFSANAFSQGANTTQGKEFWVAFGTIGSTPANDAGLALQIRIVASEATTGTMRFMTDGTTVPFSIGAGEVFTYSLSAAEKAKVYGVYQNVAVGSSYSGTHNRSLYVETSKNVSVYAINLRQSTTDATNVLPVTNYGISYYALSYKSLSTGNSSDGYAIVADESNTLVYDEGTHVATLGRGEVYYRYTGGGDQTGRNITSNKPVAFFTTNQNAFVPADKGYGDVLYQQIAPVHAWGTKFLVPVTKRGLERIRIVASQNNTIITQTGGIIQSSPGTGSLTLNAGEFVELEVFLTDKGCYIEANKSVAVASYLVGWQNFSTIAGQYPGDPAIAWVPAIEQSISSVIIAPFIATASSILTEHHALIVAPTSAKNATIMAIGSGSFQSISGGTWTDNTASGYSFYSIPLTQDEAYSFANTAGLTVLGYGLGGAESYYYLAGAAARKLDVSFYVDGMHNEDADGHTFCSGVSTLTIEAGVSFELHSAPGHLRWYVNGSEEISARDQETWTKSLSIGTHTIRMVAINLGNETVEAQATFTITNPMTPGAITGNQSINTGATPTTLTSTSPAAGGTGTITYQWQSSTNGTTWADITGATGLSYSPPALNATTYFRRVASCSCGSAETSSVLVTVSTVNVDNFITANGTEICSGDVASLSASLTTAGSVTNPVFKWYDAPTAGTLLYTGPTFTLSPSLTTTYYVSVSGTSQSETARKAVTVTVKPTATPAMIKITQ